MFEPTEGQDYHITVTHTFDGKFVYFENIQEVKHAVFETGGTGRYGKHYRKVPVDNIVRHAEVA